MLSLSRIALLAALGLGSAGMSLAAVQPYAPEVHTLHLWHLDEAGTPATNAFAGGTNLTALSGGATLGNPAFPGFGASLSTVDGGQSATIVTDKDAALSALPLVNGTGDDSPLLLADPLTGAFTFEALLRVDFNPLSNLAARASSMQIISGDGDGTTDRVFQWRLVPVGIAAGVASDTTVPRLEFINLRQTAAIQYVVFPIPTNGPNAIASNQWYHVAVTYDGNEGSADNFRAYWTLLDPTNDSAALLGTATLANDLSVAGCDFTLGNEGRATGGSTDNFVGLIDEVRISSVARAPNEFVFRSVNVTASSTEPATTNYPANTLDGNLNSRWSAQGDGEWLTYDLGRYELVTSVDIAFYLGNTRTATFAVLLSNDNLNWRTVLTNASSSGATLALQNFDFTDWPARYVRIVGHGNSVNNFNSFTEVAINYSTPGDTDADGLPDVWEMFYFTNLTQTATGNPDNDGFNNGQEFLRGTDPTQPNSVVDSDNDGLPDTWEQTNFGNLSQGAAGDPDRDGFSNLVEYQNGSDPNNPNSIPGDVDGDSLPDAWELAQLGTLNYWAYEDPDGDGYNNVAEMIAGTSATNAVSRPAWKAPRVAWLRDSIVTNNACLMPSGATYGRAINGIAFQTDILRTFNGYQYTAWYDTIGTTQIIWLARRSVTNTSVGAWELFRTGSEFLNGDESAWNAHCVIALGISPVDGTLHFAWDHHGHTLRYRRSVPGLCTTNTAAWGPGGMLLAEQNWLVAAGQTVTSVTYPRFFNAPDGKLVFTYRTGSTSAGDHWLHNYQPATGNWSARWQIEAKEGNYTGVLKNGVTGTSTSRNAYENGYDFAPDGTLHHTWTFREAADAANHDICYSYSTDGGITWRNNAGTVIADTTLGQAIRVDSPGIIIKVLDGRQRLINQQGQCVDRDGRVHVLALHRRVEPGNEWNAGESNNQFSTAKTAYYHYFRDPTTGVWSQRQIPPAVYGVGARPAIGFDAQGNVYGVFLSYPPGTDTVPGYRNGQLVIASASKASQYTDWEIVQALPTDFNGEPRIDQPRLLADRILSVFIQENSATTTVVGTPLHVIDFAVGVSQPDPVALDFMSQDVLVTVAGTPGYTYQLRTRSSLTATWVTNGVPVTGSGGLLTLPDPNGRSAGQRYYNVIRNP
jgi:hypothetical protein